MSLKFFFKDSLPENYISRDKNAECVCMNDDDAEMQHWQRLNGN